MGSSFTALDAESFEDLLRRALHDKTEAWRKKYRVETYTPTPYDEDDDESPWSEAEDIDHTFNGTHLKGVDSGGGEGEGSNAYVVVKVTHPGGHVQHFRKNGYYASHYGYDWDGELYEVKPVEKTITVYEEKV